MGKLWSEILADPALQEILFCVGIILLLILVIGLWALWGSIKEWRENRKMASRRWWDGSRK